MTILSLELQADEIGDTADGEARGFSYDADATVRIANDAAENGYPQEPGPLTWLNSARITTDPADDAVHCLVSVGDPRGAFCFTVRRTPDGRILIHMPRPGEGMAHVETRELHPGTLELIDRPQDTFPRPIDFSDSEPEEEDDA